MNDHIKAALLGISLAAIAFAVLLMGLELLKPYLPA